MPAKEITTKKWEWEVELRITKHRFPCDFFMRWWEIVVWITHIRKQTAKFIPHTVSLLFTQIYSFALWFPPSLRAHFIKFFLYFYHIEFFSSARIHTKNE